MASRIQRPLRFVPLKARSLLLLGLGFGMGVGIEGAVLGQSADDYYHNGAQFFIFGENEKAKTEVETGQRLYPNDAKLNELAALLKKPEQPPNKGDKQDQQKDKDKEKQKEQDKGDKQKQEPQQNEQKEKQEQPQQQQQQQGQENKDQQKKKEEAQKQGQQGQPSEQPEDAEGAPDKAQAVRMTPQQAVQLLEALKGEEKVMAFRPALKTNRHERVFKDW